MPEQITLTEEAWARVEARLRAYVRRRVDPLWADDVVGDVLLRLVQHRDDLETSNNPVAWILRVAANAVADHHRRRAAEKRALARVETLDEDEATPEGPETNRAADELARYLVPFIRALSDQYAEALMLTDIEGLTQAAAARRLGLSHSGMKSRVQRGRAKLRQALLRCCAVSIDRRGRVMDYRPRSRGC
ncbi:MAG: sigma-70 family RNA polymerase sigma factor [Methyloligellaceae bacterium]